MPRLDLRIKSIDTGTCVISSNSRGLNYFMEMRNCFALGFILMMALDVGLG